MWYLEGEFVSNNVNESVDFESLAKSLVINEVFNDFSKGISIKIKESDSETHAVVLGFAENKIILRRLANKLNTYYKKQTFFGRIKNYLMKSLDVKTTTNSK